MLTVTLSWCDTVYKVLKLRKATCAWQACANVLLFGHQWPHYSYVSSLLGTSCKIAGLSKKKYRKTCIQVSSQSMPDVPLTMSLTV